MSPLRMIYLALAIWGAIQPMRWFMIWAGDHGWGLRTLLDGWHANAGYATQTHRAALHRLGLTVHHRQGFGTVRQLRLIGLEVVENNT